MDRQTIDSNNLNSSINTLSQYLNVLQGRFLPDNLSAQLFFDEDELSEKSHIYYHERFHYLQMIFTPYGHIRWGVYRSWTSDIIENWLQLYHKHNKGYISSDYYLDDMCKDDIAPLTSLFIYYQAWILFQLPDTHFIPEPFKKVYPQLDDLLPKITYNEVTYEITTQYVLEGFAKFEEALYQYIFKGVEIEKTIDPNILNPEYYCLFYYFIDKLGPSRILEFPVVCELALRIQHLPQKDNLAITHAGCRFLTIIDYLCNHPNIKLESITSDSAFVSYAKQILNGCGFGEWDGHWDTAIKYASSSDLKISTEMLDAIKYIQQHPRALSYAILDPLIFKSDEFRKFHPLFTLIGENPVFNLNSISVEEMTFENDYQALAFQIMGIQSQRCIYPDMLQCGDSYFGLKQCDCIKKGLCDGQINKDSELLNIELDNDYTLKFGCPFEVFLQAIGCTLKNIDVKDSGKIIGIDDIPRAAKKLL